MEIEVKEVTDQKEKRTISRRVLYVPPEWFGLPEDTEEYITGSQNKPFLICYVGGKIAGYVVLNTTGADCTDVFVMGAKKEFHHMGIGSKLNATYGTVIKKLGCIYSQVKTAQIGHYKECDITNRFYLAISYKELECFPILWDERNPCQTYIKHLGK